MEHHENDNAVNGGLEEDDVGDHPVRQQVWANTVIIAAQRRFLRQCMKGSVQISDVLGSPCPSKFLKTILIDTF